MAFDGITINALVNELHSKLANGRINKIAQTEKDELFLTIKNEGTQYKLMLSVNASLPLAYLTDTNKNAPLTAPAFCMLLRKYINSGRIVSVTQPGLERIIDIKIEHFDEMGDLCIKHIMTELMGKYSNIIFIDDNNRIIDSIKRINASVSSIREVLPGYDYFIPETMNKRDALSTSSEEFRELITHSNSVISKAIYNSYTGISPQIAEDLCLEADIDSSKHVTELSENEILHLSNMFLNMIDDIKKHNYSPAIYYENDAPYEYSVIPVYLTDNMTCISYSTISSMLESYYTSKNKLSRIHQRSASLRQVINTALERNYKKYDLQQRQLKDTEKRDKYRIYGELLNTYGYSIPDGSSSYEVLNYYTNEMITIPLDTKLSALENARKYFTKYNKLKRTYEAMTEQTVSTKNEIDHLESISTSLDIAVNDDDLNQIREELVQFGYMKNNLTDKKGRTIKSKSRPFHYISSDGFDIFVGKNNIQNEELTFKTAAGNDMWFHAKNMPGSHVIVRTNNNELPDRTYEEAARLAAFYSKGSKQEKVEVDYIQRKQLKKVNGAAPGFVIYHSNYSMMAVPNISGIREV